MAGKKRTDITDRRLRNQRIAGAGFETPGGVVAWLGAVQAQDYLGALWALGLRMETAREKAIEQALADRRHLEARLQEGVRSHHSVALRPAKKEGAAGRAERYGAFLGRPTVLA